MRQLPERLFLILILVFGGFTRQSDSIEFDINYCHLGKQECNSPKSRFIFTEIEEETEEEKNSFRNILPMLFFPFSGLQNVFYKLPPIEKRQLHFWDGLSSFSNTGRIILLLECVLQI